MDRHARKLKQRAVGNFLNLRTHFIIRQLSTLHSIVKTTRLCQIPCLALSGLSTDLKKWSSR